MAGQGDNCSFQGNADMYGMGIRIGYYLQWYGSIIAAWLASEQSQGLRIANSLFVTATFIALIILTARQHSPDDLPAVETYIILFLTFGNYLVLVPIYIWRLFTGCNPLWDPTRFPRVNPGQDYTVYNTLVVVAVLIFQIWFWAQQVPQLNGVECKRYGFFFTKFVLNSTNFRGINLSFNIILLMICLTTVGVVLWKNSPWAPARRRVNLNHESLNRIRLLNYVESISQAVVATVVIIGVELTILWNQIEGVHDVSTAGQMIPLFLGIGSVGLVLYVWALREETVEPPAGNPVNDMALNQLPNTVPRSFTVGALSAVGARTVMSALRVGDSGHTRLRTWR
ncbi:hypothetical protein BDV96DRAFT_189022 [Lophiotrema nucula]|uniref:Uncharacterized protein n=1 Tax=Lophiotrema nucula TaxID=690887 RepID=A0A6A5YW72_9PLEO|nr:hypothetical protein BDV96DRAFT_189022 [Lophiotrema nucula]